MVQFLLQHFEVYTHLLDIVSASSLKFSTTAFAFKDVPSVDYKYILFGTNMHSILNRINDFWVYMILPLRLKQLQGVNDEGKFLMNSETKEDNGNPFRRFSITSFIYYCENINLTALSHNIQGVAEK
jgi:hypothetical protein